VRGPSPKANFRYRVRLESPSTKRACTIRRTQSVKSGRTARAVTRMKFETSDWMLLFFSAGSQMPVRFFLKLYNTAKTETPRRAGLAFAISGRGSDLGETPSRAAGPTLCNPLGMAFGPLGDFSLTLHHALHWRDGLGHIDQAYILALCRVVDEADRDDQLQHLQSPKSSYPLLAVHNPRSGSSLFLFFLMQR
jgi:hypothetical protein